VAGQYGRVIVALTKQAPYLQGARGMRQRSQAGRTRCVEETQQAAKQFKLSHAGTRQPEQHEYKA